VNASSKGDELSAGLAAAAQARLASAEAECNVARDKLAAEQAKHAAAGEALRQPLTSAEASSKSDELAAGLAAAQARLAVAQARLARAEAEHDTAGGEQEKHAVAVKALRRQLANAEGSSKSDELAASLAAAEAKLAVVQAVAQASLAVAQARLVSAEAERDAARGELAAEQAKHAALVTSSEYLSMEHELALGSVTIELDMELSAAQAEAARLSLRLEEATQRIAALEVSSVAPSPVRDVDDNKIEELRAVNFEQRQKLGRWRDRISTLERSEESLLSEVARLRSASSTLSGSPLPAEVSAALAVRCAVFTEPALLAYVCARSFVHVSLDGNSECLCRRRSGSNGPWKRSGSSRRRRRTR
jgi:chromosome segregation ATPase